MIADLWAVGDKKSARVFVHELIDGEYQVTPFRNQNRIVSPTFPDFGLTVDRLFESAGS